MNLLEYKKEVGSGAFRRLAEAAGTSANFVSLVANGHKRLTFETAQKLKMADASGRLGILDMIEGNRAQMLDREARREAAAAA